jgi:hypothetical protein
MEKDLDQALKASFWTRAFPINPLYILGGFFVVAIYVVLPAYLYTSKLKNVCCDPDIGTVLSCNATEAATGGITTVSPPDDIAPSLRKLLAPTVNAVIESVGAHLVGSEGSSQQRPGGSDSGVGGDPWARYVARG